MKWAAISILALAIPSFAAEPKLTVKQAAIDLPKDLAPAFRELMDRNTALVNDSADVMATIWLRNDIPAKSTKDGPSYHSIAMGTLIGVVNFKRPWTDFRHQEISAGTYTLRIVLQPETKDHEGTAPYRDFCILCPVAEDTRPDSLTPKEMTKKSGTATGGTHPVVMLLFPNEKPEEKPTLIANGKRIAVGMKARLLVADSNASLGFAFTIVGKSTD